MKTLKLLSILTLSTLLLFISCQNDDDSDSNMDNNADLILGTWSFVSSTTNGVTDTFEDPCELLFVITFLDNGDFNRTEFSGDNCGTSTQFTGSYSLNGNNVTVTIAEATFINEILTLNELNLSVTYVSNGDVFIENYTKTSQSSDRRLKKDIENLSYGLKEIMQLQPKAYNWKSRKQKNKSFGLIAQDVLPIINNVVHRQNNEKKTLSISYIELIPVLIKAIQEQQTIISSQNKINIELTQRIELIEATNNQ